MKIRLLVAAILALVCMARYEVGHANQGTYLGLLGGFNWLNYPIDDFETDMNTGYVIGAVGGYKFWNGISFEGEVAFRRNNLGEVRAFSERLPFIGYTEITTVMANALYELSSPYPLRPYVGIGLGYAHVDERASGMNLLLIGKDDSFAWQAIVGFEYPIECNTGLGVEYRYLHPTDFIDDHALCLRLKQFF